MNKLTAEKCREQFEEWLTSMPGFEAADIEKREDGKYNYVETEWCWKSWQASRDALPILEQQERGEWIEWGGGERPISASTRVELKLRSEKLPDSCVKACDVDWKHRSWCQGIDIIAYRIIPEQIIEEDGSTK